MAAFLSRLLIERKAVNGLSFLKFKAKLINQNSGKTLHNYDILTILCSYNNEMAANQSNGQN